MSKKNEFEKDMDILAKIRDVLNKDFKAATIMHEKLAIAEKIANTIHAREEAEFKFLHLIGAFNDNDDENDYCEGCPECDPKLNEIDKSESN